MIDVKTLKRISDENANEAESKLTNEFLDTYGDTLLRAAKSGSYDVILKDLPEPFILNIKGLERGLKALDFKCSVLMGSDFMVWWG